MFTRVAALTLALAAPLAFAAKDARKAKDSDDESPSVRRPAARVVPQSDPSPAPRDRNRDAPPPRVRERSVGSAVSSAPRPAVGSSSGNTHSASNPTWEPPKARANGSNGGRTHGASPIGSGRDYDRDDRHDDDDDDDDDRYDRHDRYDRAYHYHANRHFDGCGHHYYGGGWVWVDDGRPYVDYGYDDNYSRPVTYVAAPVDPNRVPSVDFGVAVGLNAPAGALGFEAEWRPLSGLGLGLHGGVGAWGARFSPVVRLYPMGARFGLFAEGALSANDGGYSELVSSGQDVLLEQVATASVSIGLRQTHDNNFFTSVKVGYQWRTDFRPAYQAEGTLNSNDRMMLDFLQPGGLVLGASAGISFW